MNLSALQPGTLIEANVRGVKFKARVEKLVPDGGSRQLVKVEPLDPKRYSYRFLGARQVVGKVAV